MPLVPPSSDPGPGTGDPVGTDAGAIPGVAARPGLSIRRSRTWERVVGLLSTQPLDFEEERKRLLFGPMIVMATAMLAIFGVYHLMTGGRVEGTVDLAAAGLLAFALIRLRRVPDGRMIYKGAVIFLALLFTYFGTLSDHPYRASWALVYPLFALFVAGERFGLAMSLALFAAWIALMTLPTGLTGAYDFPVDLTLRFGAAYIVITLGSLFMEQVRHMYAEAMRRHHEGLERANLDLTISGERLRGMAMVDPLTRVANRRAIRAHLEGELERAARTGRPLSVAVLDVDHFKRINDTHGHGVGDAVLRKTARRIASSLRSYDRVGRYGGEEFLLVLPGAAAGAATSILERVREKLASRTIDVDELRVELTVSIGLATLAPDSRPWPTLDEIVALADRAMYRAKREGRNRVRAHA